MSSGVDKEILEWNEMVKILFEMEASCPKCIEAKQKNEGTLNPLICLDHQKLRQRMVFPKGIKRR